MNLHTAPGYGDQITWAPCTGHPNDPRTVTDDFDVDVREALSEVRGHLRMIEQMLDDPRGYSRQAVESLMTEAAGWLGTE